MHRKNRGDYGGKCKNKLHNIGKQILPFINRLQAYLCFSSQKTLLKFTSSVIMQIIHGGVKSIFIDAKGVDLNRNWEFHFGGLLHFMHLLSICFVRFSKHFFVNRYINVVKKVLQIIYFIKPDSFRMYILIIFFSVQRQKTSASKTSALKYIKDHLPVLKLSAKISETMF